jgi:hypothetical protein
MNMSVWRRGAASLAAVVVIAGAAGCQGDGGTKKGASENGAPDPQQASQRAQAPSDAADAVTAAYEKTSDAKSAKVRMTMSMPASPGAAKGDLEMSGVMGWDPTVMDMTMKGAALSPETSGLSEIRMIWRDNVMYMDMGAAAAKDMDGKRWMKLDVGALAGASGDKALEKQLTGGLENMNQDPARQLALLLDSPNLKHLGSEEVDGVRAEHYRGTLTLDEMVKSNGSLDVLSAKERQDLIDSMKKSGMKGYDTEVWVNEDDYPVKMDIGMDTLQGEITLSAHYSDYGAAARVEVPPTAETFDIAELMDAAGDTGSTGAAG